MSAGISAAILVDEEMIKAVASHFVVNIENNRRDLQL
jgi:hypothetical protein